MRTPVRDGYAFAEPTPHLSPTVRDDYGAAPKSAGHSDRLRQTKCPSNEKRKCFLVIPKYLWRTRSLSTVDNRVGYRHDDALQ